MSDLPQKILFAGTPRFAADHLGALLQSEHPVVAVYTQPDRPGKRGSKLLPSPVKEVAIEAGLPVRQPSELNGEVLDEMRGFAPDVAVVVAYGHKLPTAMLDLPRHGCINVHASLLPRWRGAAPIQRAILHGDEETGITIMRIDEGWDTGEILLQRSCPIGADDTAGALEEKLSVLGQSLLIEALTRLAEGTITPTPQQEGVSTYAKKLSKDEAAIDWSGSAGEVCRAVRAYSPSPVAYTWLEAMRVRVWEAHAIDASGSGAPGEILAVQREGVDVRCGDGAVRLTKLQIPVGQGRVLPVADILNARRDLFVPGRLLTATEIER